MDLEEGFNWGSEAEASSGCNVWEHGDVENAFADCLIEIGSASRSLRVPSVGVFHAALLLRHMPDVCTHSAIGYNVAIALHYPGGAATRHRERAGKFQLPAIQGWGSVQVTRRLRFQVDECRASEHLHRSLFDSRR